MQRMTTTAVSITPDCYLETIVCSMLLIQSVTIFVIKIFCYREQEYKRVERIWWGRLDEREISEIRDTVALAVWESERGGSWVAACQDARLWRSGAGSCSTVILESASPTWPAPGVMVELSVLSSTLTDLISYPGTLSATTHKSEYPASVSVCSAFVIEALRFQCP